MVFQTRPRLILALLSAAVVASTLSCNQPSGQRFIRLGDDLIASGSTVDMTDSVTGDAIFSGRYVDSRGAVGGDYLGLGGNQTIGGRIHGSIRAAGGEVHVMTVVDRNATIAGGSITLDSTADIGRNAYLIGGNIHVNGTVRGALLASGGSVVLNGVIDRDVEVAGGELRVGPHAVITGNLRYRVPARKVHIDPAARIAGTVTALPVSRGWGVWHWLWLLGFLVAGAVAVFLFSGFITEAAEILPQRPFRSALVGLGWALLTPIAMVLAAITIIGLPLAIFTGLLWLVVVCLCDVPFALWVGKRLLGGRVRTGRAGALLNFIVGGFLLLVVGIVPVLGPIVTTIAGLAGFGAIMLRALAMRRGTQRV